MGVYDKLSRAWRVAHLAFFVWKKKRRGKKGSRIFGFWEGKVSSVCVAFQDGRSLDVLASCQLCFCWGSFCFSYCSWFRNPKQPPFGCDKTYVNSRSFFIFCPYQLVSHISSITSRIILGVVIGGRDHIIP